MKVLVNLSGDHSKWLRHSRMLGIVIKPILEALVTVDQLYLRTHRVPPLYQSGVRYQEEPLNRVKLGESPVERIEDFSSIPAVLERGHGDCFPAGTLLLAKHGAGGMKIVPIEDIEFGDFIWGLDSWTRVEAIAPKGRLLLDTFSLNNGAKVRLTPGHKVYVVSPDGTESRIPVAELQQGMVLPQPNHLSSLIRRRPPTDTGGLRVMGIDREASAEACWDIQTSDHRVFLPEHDVTVSNCDDLAPWRCAELREAGEPAKIRVQWKRDARTGQKLFHILVRRADGSIEDPSLKLGMRTGPS